MTTELQHAFLNDDLQVVQRKIKLGSYPHVVYKKALDKKAWICLQWVASTFSTALSVWQWCDLSMNNNIIIDPSIVRHAHMHGIEHAPCSHWVKSVVSWEIRGVAFTHSFYEALWRSQGISFKTSQYVAKLGMFYRFEPIEVWLSGEQVPSEKEVTRVFKQLWDHAILRCDSVLFSWLGCRVDRAALMDHLYSGISARSLALPSFLARRKNQIVWNVDTFLKDGVPSFFSSVDHFCQYVALYETRRLRHVWSKVSSSQLISSEWRTFLDSDATLPVPGHRAQCVVMVLRGLFPTDEKMRMLECLNAENSDTMFQADLVDIL